MRIKMLEQVVKKNDKNHLEFVVILLKTMTVDYLNRNLFP